MSVTDQKKVLFFLISMALLNDLVDQVDNRQMALDEAVEKLKTIGDQAAPNLLRPAAELRTSLAAFSSLVKSEPPQSVLPAMTNRH